jgi:hypothetical protein
MAEALAPEIRENKIRAYQNVTQIERAHLWKLDSLLSLTDRPSNSSSFVVWVNKNGRWGVINISCAKPADFTDQQLHPMVNYLQDHRLILQVTP